MTEVHRRDRFVDVVALVLILLGAALYANSQVRFRAIMQYSWKHPGPRGVSQVRAADVARYEANAAFMLVAVGAAVGVTAAVRHSRRSRPLSGDGHYDEGDTHHTDGSTDRNPLRAGSPRDLHRPLADQH